MNVSHLPGNSNHVATLSPSPLTFSMILRWNSFTHLTMNSYVFNFYHFYSNKQAPYGNCLPSVLNQNEDWVFMESLPISFPSSCCLAYLNDSSAITRKAMLAHKKSITSFIILTINLSIYKLWTFGLALLSFFTLCEHYAFYKIMCKTPLFNLLLLGSWLCVLIWFEMMATNKSSMLGS